MTAFRQKQGEINATGEKIEKHHFVGSFSFQVGKYQQLFFCLVQGALKWCSLCRR
jgi:hypothetical protein